MGQEDQAQQRFREFEKTANRLSLSPYIWAIYYFTIEKNEKGFEWLNKALARRDHLLWYLKVDPVFDSVRSDPRYLELLRKVGLD